MLELYTHKLSGNNTHLFWGKKIQPYIMVKMKHKNIEEDIFVIVTYFLIFLHMRSKSKMIKGKLPKYKIYIYTNLDHP